MSVGRRKVLNGALVAAAASSFPAPFIHAQGKPTLRFVANSATENEETIRRASKDLGVNIEFTPTTIYGVFQSMVTDPNSADLIGADVFTFKTLLKLGRTLAIDTNRLKHFSNVAPALSKGQVDGVTISDQGDAPIKSMYVGGPDQRDYLTTPTQWVGFIPSHHQADTLGVRPDLVGREVNNWGDLFSPDFAGKAALVNLPGVGIIDAALAIESLGIHTYSDKGHMTRDEIDLTLNFLIERKKEGHFNGLWATFCESIDFMASGNVVIQSMWWPAVLAVRQQGIACRYQPLQEGYRGWTQGYGLSRAILDDRTRDVAYEYLNWSLSGWKGAKMLRVGFYPSVLDTAKEYMSDAEWDYWIRGKPASEEIKGATGDTVAQPGDVFDGGSYEDRMSKVAVWNSNMDEVRYLTRRWREFGAA